MVKRTALDSHISHLIRSWVAIFIGLWAGLAAIVVACVVGSLPAMPDDLLSLGGLATLCVALVVYVLLAGVLAWFSALLATPLLMLHRFIVGPRPPYLRPGYIAVIVYGPALAALAGDHKAPQPSSWPIYAAYEVVVLIATLTYARLGRRFGLFPPKRQRSITSPIVATAPSHTRP